MLVTYKHLENQEPRNIYLHAVNLLYSSENVGLCTEILIELLLRH